MASLLVYKIFSNFSSIFLGKDPLVKDKSHEVRGGVKWMTMRGGVDCQGVRGCNLVHIDPSGVFCHAPHSAGLHYHCMQRTVFCVIQLARR